MTLIPKLHYKVYGGKFEKVMKKVGRRLLYEGRKWREEMALIHNDEQILEIFAMTFFQNTNTVHGI